MQVVFIFPHQLFESHPALQKNREVYLLEDPLFFTQYNFHKQKLILHRASMKYYQHFLEKKNFTVHYIESNALKNLSLFYRDIAQKGITEIHYAEVVDYLLDKRIHRHSQKHGLSRVCYETPNFLTSTEQFVEQLGEKKKYLMASFYMAQRKRLNVLTEKDGSPVGGKWSFDTENRKAIPKGLRLPNVLKPAANSFVLEAEKYVEQNFSGNYGNASTFSYPTTHTDAQNVLEDFIRHRLEKFGDYEDAILKDESVLFHSVLTPALNIGLINPQQVLNTVLIYHGKKKIPLNSLEGFARQIIGWREFMKGVYQHEGTFERTRNFFGFSRKIPRSFWLGTTGLVPVDVTIKKILESGYAHHIERLMILGNFMLLCEFDPDEVYRWFMELFIDAYDWVMVPNVYGMTQYSDGGLMTTKPYISGSNYVLKMSDYTKGPWCEIWDALYWRFLFVHQEKFKGNQRMGMMLQLLKKMNPEKLQSHLAIANAFLKKLD